MKLNYQVEIQDHNHVQVQSQKKENLPKCQWDLKFGQVHVSVLKLNLDFQNDKESWVISIRFGIVELVKG